MKLKNKGHEFDKLGEVFKKNKNLLVLGDDISLKNIKEELNFLDIKIKYDSFILKLLKTNPYIVKILIGKNKTIIIADDNIDTLKKLIKICNLEENQNIFLASDFIKTYLSIFASYVCNKVYSSIGTCLIITTHCSLNCKYCLNYQPYIKNKKHIDFENLKNDIDIFFSCFDRVKYFSLTGGEPMLHPRIKEIIEYIGENYRHKIKILGTAINGTILPSDEVFQAIKKYDVELICDNYTKSAPYTKETHEKIIKKSEELGLNYKKTGDITFFKTFPPKKENTQYSSEKKLIEKFNECKKFYSGHEIKEGKLYACCYSGFAQTAELLPVSKEDVFSLNNFSEKQKYELIEFKLDYNEKGYVDFCKYCNGFPSINNEFDENGVTQLKKGELLDWDIKNPTYL